MQGSQYPQSVPVTAPICNPTLQGVLGICDRGMSNQRISFRKARVRIHLEQLIEIVDSRPEQRQTRSSAGRGQSIRVGLRRKPLISHSLSITANGTNSPWPHVTVKSYERHLQVESARKSDVHRRRFGANPPRFRSLGERRWGTSCESSYR